MAGNIYPLSHALFCSEIAVNEIPFLMLIVEDDAGLTELIGRVLKDKGWHVAAASCGQEALSRLKTSQPGLILLDYSLPDMTGAEFLEEAIARNLPIPAFIVATGVGDERLAVEMMKRGARDYLVKDGHFLEVLPLAVSKTLEHIETERRLARVQQELRESEQRFLTAQIEELSLRRRQDEEKQHLEAQLYQARKLEAIGLLAGGIAHDLNNLLSPILGYGEMLVTDVALSETHRRDVSEIISAGERARDLINQLMAFGRKQILEVKSLDLSVVVTDFFKFLRRTIREDIRVELLPSPTISAILADRNQIEQILMNLAMNAQDAMPAGGTLTISTENIMLGAADVALDAEIQPGQYVRLVVGDTGSGMDPDTCGRIFEPFFTTKVMGKGTGLGLATVYGIVKQHEGHIRVESKPDCGTRFRILFPAYDPAGSAVEVSGHKKAEPPKGHETVLVAEDDASMRKLVVSMLTQLGYRVLVGETAGKCLDIAKTHSQPIDILFTDVVMPEMNGKELFSRISQVSSISRVLYMSGHSTDVISNQGVLENGLFFIQKPFTLRAMAEKLRQVLDKG